MAVTEQRHLELASILGPVDPDLLASLMTTDAVASYQEQGRSSASSHVLVDAERLFGLAYAVWKSKSRSCGGSVSPVSGEARDRA